MAAVASTNTVKITIDDIELEVPSGEMIVESAKRLGLDIPIFCYHPRLKPVGMCRMCLVEVGMRQPDGTVRKMPKPQTACTLPASNNLAIYTNTEQVRKDRKGVLEFLLINHPLDCPVCDRGGECPLQNNTLFYGPSTSRFIDPKRHNAKAYPLSQYVTLDLERCIQCARCVRFTEEISGDSQLAFRYRGANTFPSTFQLTEFESKFSGNVIEICPVGALTSSKYRFRARPWDLETSPAICTMCSNGCNVWFDHRSGKLVRINGRTNESVNEEWTCDRGKFGHDWYNAEDRLKRPLVRDEGTLKPASWTAAYQAIVGAFSGGAAQVGALVRARVSNESLYLLQKLFRGTFGSNNLDHRWTKHLPTRAERPANPAPTTFTALEAKKSVLVFGTSLADDEPMLFLRLRKTWFQQGAKVAVATTGATDADSFADVVLRIPAGQECAVAAAMLNAAFAAGRAQLTDEWAKRIASFTPEKVEKSTGVSAASLKAASEVLGADGAILTSWRLFDAPEAQEVLEVLSVFAQAVGAEFNCYGLEANDQGATELGILPDALPGGAETAQGGLNTEQILTAAAEGKLKALWLVDCDPLSLWPDKALARKALENVPFLVYQGTNLAEAAHYASVVLPMAAPAEQDGSYTNLERRVQRMKQAVAAPGEAKPAWCVYAELAAQVEPGTPPFSADEVRAAIVAGVPAFAGVTDETMAQEGALLAPLA